MKVIAEDSPTAKAGLKKNDIITKLNEIEVVGSDELKKFISDSDAGDTVVLYVYRQGNTLELQMEVESLSSVSWIGIFKL